MPTVRLPDGSTAKFPDGMAPKDIEAAITAHLASNPARPAGLPAGMDLPGFPAAPTPDMQPSAIGKAAPALLTGGDVLTGAAKSVPGTIASTYRGLGKLVGGVPSDTMLKMEQAAVPTNTAQRVGNAVGNAAQFLIPGAGEEEAAAKLAPYVGKALPAVKMGLAALGSGTVNAAQGGSFGTGAVAGGVGSGLGMAMKSIAPAIAESALNIRKLDRAYGKGGGAIGRAILDDTTGITPEAVAESAQNRLNVLNPQLNAAADRASTIPNPAKGLLPAPAMEIPLQSSEPVAATPTRNVVLNQPTRPAPLALPAPMRDIPMSSHADIFPDQLPSARTSVPTSAESPASGVSQDQYFGQIPGERGGPGQVQGVLMRPAEVGSGPLPALPNNIASLGGAKGVISDALNTATRQGERTTVNQLQPLITHLGQSIDGTPIPDNVTPRQLLDLKRGFGSEFIHRWNPETMQGVKGTAAQTYHALGSEFNAAVPEAEGLNSQISTMIPVAKRAESAELNAPTTQRMFQRIAAPTGALTGALGGGVAGYKQDGAQGALEGAGAGLLAPLLLTTPTGQMALARMLNRVAQPAMKGLTGLGLQMSERNKPATTAVPR